MALAASVVTLISGLSAVGQVENFTTTVPVGPCTKTFWPLIPEAWKNGTAGSRIHQQFR